MEQLIHYFETIPSLHRSVILVGGLTFFWILEGSLPLFKFSYNKWKHAFPNLFFTFTTIIINFTLAFLLLGAADWVVFNEFGILNWLPEMPLWLYVLLGVLLMDFVGAYLPHFTEHKVPPLWMVHLVHHSDHKVDTTTANRHHPLESIIRYVFTLAGVFIIGAPIGIVMLYQSMSLIATQFSHANIKLPKKLDYALSFTGFDRKISPNNRFAELNWKAEPGDGEISHEVMVPPLVVGSMLGLIARFFVPVMSLLE